MYSNFVVVLVLLLQIYNNSSLLLNIKQNFYYNENRYSHALLHMVATTPAPPTASYNSNDDGTYASSRLTKARLRLAEVQGIIPIGASETPDVSLTDISNVLNSGGVIPNISKTRVREISWRVAEPSVRYDPIAASKKFFSQPLTWISRNIQFTTPVAVFGIKVISDILGNKEETNRSKRAEELLNIVSIQSPALIKAGQALASRSDLLPKEYLTALQTLQDRCPPYPTEKALDTFKTELGQDLSDVIDLDSTEPVAAASIGQVYRGTLKSNGAKVAIKIQRPDCEEAIAIDLFILRFYASAAQTFLNALGRNIDLVSVIDDFGDLIYREIDYRAEAVNAQRFAELYANIPNIFVPKIYTDLSSSKVLTMEWVDGCRLNDEKSIQAFGLDSTELVKTLIQCSLRQMLENGFFHADPHAGNLLAMKNGKLCYLDFGMVSYVEASQRYSIIEAVVHLVNRDYEALAELYKRIGFIPNDVDTAPIIVALEDALPDVLNAAVGDFNFKSVIGKLGDVMYKFPFSLPPFYISIIRCLGVLEGLTIEVDKDFQIINDAYPYIASRLLTDQSEELQSALKQLLFKDNEPRWQRLQELFENAAVITDYDSTLAIDSLLSYIISDQGLFIRDLLIKQVVSSIDELSIDASDYSAALASTLLSNPSMFLSEIAFTTNSVDTFIDKMVSIQKKNNHVTKQSIENAINAIKYIQKSYNNGSIDTNKINKIVRKYTKEPVIQKMISTILADLTERSTSRVIGRIFNVASA